MDTELVGVGIVGLGARGTGGFGGSLCDVGRESGLRVAAVHDTDHVRLAAGAGALKERAGRGDLPTDFAVHHSLDDLVADGGVDMVAITSPQYAHEEAFLPTAKAGKAIYCDKPLASTWESCQRIREAGRASGARCVVGLTRRYEGTWRQATALVREGAIGTPQMMLLRGVIPYFRYFGGGWWRRKHLSGDILNEKASHYFDVFNWFAQSRPVTVYAAGGRRVLIPRPGYPQRCGDCDRDCPYRRKPGRAGREEHSGWLFDVMSDDSVDLLAKDLCVYSDEADISDHATVTVEFANGVKAMLFFTIFGPDTEDQETFEVVGDEGRLILNRHAGTIDLVAGHGATRTVQDCTDEDFPTSHFGADRRLIRTIGRFVRGEDPPVGLEDAYLASQVAFEAQTSMETGTVRRIEAADRAGSHDGTVTEQHA